MRPATKYRWRRAAAMIGLGGSLIGPAGCGATWPKPGTPAAAAEWPAALVGAWAWAGSPARGGTVPDTLLWVLGSAGRLERREVQRRPRGDTLTSRERTSTISRWWTKDGHADGVSPWTVCTSQRPGRGSQCARVVLDTVTDAAGHARRRLTWTGVTFRDQHWALVER